MKLAECLQERADLNRRIAQLKKRLSDNALVQDGEKTLEDPVKLKKELDGDILRLQELITKINLSNAAIEIEGESLTSLLARRDMLVLKIASYRDIVNEASKMNYRARGSEIKIKAAIDVAAWQKEIDKYAKELRLLDNKIQAANWYFDLKE